MWLRTARRGLLAALVALTASACLSPTLPLPPPSAPEQVGPIDANGEVTLQGGGAEPGSYVFVFDQGPVGNASSPTAGQGAIVTADAAGGWLVKVKATAGDRFVAWYEAGTERSPISDATTVK